MDSPTWAQRKAWNNDGMDPDWRPSAPPPAADTAFALLKEWITKLDLIRMGQIPQERAPREIADIEAQARALIEK